MDLTLVGLSFGIVFGAVLQRGRFCIAAAARDLFLTKDTYLAKGVLYAILFTSIGFFLAQSQGLLELQIKPLGLQNIIGGLLFGVGMVIAGGCASGVLYRAGEGYITAFTAILGVLFGIAVYAELYEYLIVGFVDSTTIGTLTVYGVLGVSPWTLIVLMSIIAVVVKSVLKKRH
ncbi:MAG: YeeE/YedE thiosulfate transporter family protein [Methanosarcinaceae archaeon]|nr:YeeE/YedE family protein [Methanosarcinaceae archaeon]MDF1533513.1 YeeE/YedE thiosulfate transporter family protein [Methanosarcinaceae archaeon]